jgi:hypothetical protein
MPEQVAIRVFEVVGSSLCVASDDGQEVFRRIADAIKSGQQVSLSFANVTSMTSAFLNTAVGQLYGQFSETLIREKLKVVDIEGDDLALLGRVVETAKAYFKDRERFSKARKEVLEDDSE